MAIQISSTSSSERKPRRWRSAALFVLLLLVMLVALNLAARLAEGPDYIGSLSDKLTAVDTANAVVIGPSVAKHLVPGAMCLDAPNLAESLLDPFEIEALTGHLVAHGPIPKLWIYGAIPGFEQFDNGAKAAQGGRRRVLTYRTLQSRGDWRLIDNDWKGAARAIVLPALGFQEWKQHAQIAWRRLHGRRVRRKDEAFSTRQLVDYETNHRLAVQLLAVRSAEAERIAYYGGNVPDRALESLLRTNAVLKAHGAQMVLVYMPFSPALRDIMQHDHAAELAAAQAIRQRLAAAGAIVIDDTENPDFATQVSNFRDPVHLNYDGGLRYSADLAKRLAREGLIAPPDPTACRPRPTL